MEQLASRTCMHTYIQILDALRRYRVTKTISDETGKGAKINKYLNYIIYNTTISQYCLMVGKEFAWKAVLHPALTADVRS